MEIKGHDNTILPIEKKEIQLELIWSSKVWLMCLCESLLHLFWIKRELPEWIEYSPIAYSFSPYRVDGK